MLQNKLQFKQYSPITVTKKEHLLIFPVRSVEPIFISVVPILNFMFSVKAGTLTIVGTNPELSEKCEMFSFITISSPSLF